MKVIIKSRVHYKGQLYIPSDNPIEMDSNSAKALGKYIEIIKNAKPVETMMLKIEDPIEEKPKAKKTKKNSKKK